MIERVVAWSTRHPWIVIAAALVLAVIGERSRRALSRDAVPDLSDPQIVLVADWMGHPATEVATDVTQVLTDALKSGVPGATAVRGASMTGMAYVDVVFGSASSLGAGRQAILARIDTVRARLPANLRLHVGPEASSTGWIFQYVLANPSHKTTHVSLQRLQEEILRPALASIPGVAEVATVGQRAQQLLVEVEPDKLRTRDVAFTDVVSALRPVSQGEPDLMAISALPVSDASADNPSPPRLGDVAKLGVADDMQTGIAEYGGDLHAIGGIVVARRDADPGVVIAAVKRTIEKLRGELPAAVEIVTVYDRTELADRVGHTLFRTLGEEVVVVVLVILMFLLHARSGLVPLATLPLVLLLTFLGMWLLGVSATIMSLGGIGIALGMAVDADVVALEACHRRLEGVGPGASPDRRRSAIIIAAGSFAPAILTSLLITALSFLPVFAFTGETGRLLRPLALTKTLVIVAAALVTLTLAPALRDRLLRGRILPELANPLTRTLVRMYRPFVHFALRQPVLTLVTAGLAVLSCLPLVTRLGGEFFPRVDEGDLLYMPSTLPGVSVGEAAVELRKQDHAISQFPEVATVFGKIGRATTATDPAPYSMAETTVRLRPRSEWPNQPRARWYSSWAPGPLKAILGLAWPEATPRTIAELVEELDRATRVPGWTGTWTAPARARMDMMSTGVRTPVGIRIVAADPARLDALGSAVEKWVSRLPGTHTAVFESLGGETWLRFEPDLAAAALHHVDPALIQSTTDLLVNGGQVGEIARQTPTPPDLARRRSGARGASGHGMGHGPEHGQMTEAFVATAQPPVALEPQSTPYRVRVAPDMGMNREDADHLREVTVRSSGNGQPVPLALLGHPSYVTRPAMIRTERGESVAYVYVGLDEGTDVGSFVRRSQRALEQAPAAGEIGLRSGERIEWTGQYQLMIAGEQRLQWIIPLVAISMLMLLYLQFKNLTEALIVLAAVPFALVGSVWTLFLLHYPLSAPVWVGLLSTVGLAMQTGVVMVVYIDEAFHRRVREGRLATRDDIVAAHAEGTVRRLRPKLMTITTMAAGLLPLLWADGAGAEIMRRVAAPMIGGLATSAFLTLEVLPVLYTIWRSRQLRRALRSGTPIETVVGAVPSWARG